MKRIIAQPVIYACDFETFSPNSSYHIRENDTAVYAIFATKVNSKYSFVNKKYQENPNFKPIEKGFAFIKDYIDYFIKHRRHGTLQYHYFHNFSKFDARFLEKYLLYFGEVNHNLVQRLSHTKEKIDHWELNNFNDQIKVLKIVKWLGEKEKITIEFRDSLLLWPQTKIEKFGKWLITHTDFDHGKYDLDFDLAQELYDSWDAIPEQIQLRVKYDTLILAKWFELNLNSGTFIPNGSKINLTISSLTMAHFLVFWANKLNIKHGVFTNLTGLKSEEQIELNNYFLKNDLYFGGISSFKDDAPHYEQIYIYDVNSLYPDAMAHNLHPYGKMKIYLRRPKDLNNKVVFVQATLLNVKQLRQDVPPFLKTRYIRNPDFKKQTFKNFEYQAKIYNFCENIQYWDQIMTKWFSYDIKEIKYLVFEAKDYFSDFLKPLFAEKEILDDSDIRRDFVKRLMNHLYGKFGEKSERIIYVSKKLKDYFPIDWEIIGESDNKLDYCINYLDHSKTANFAIACNITSLARLKLISTIMEHSGATYNCDTDSIFTNVKLDPDIVDNKIIGKWAFEKEGSEFKVLRSKSYLLADQGKIIKKAISGINPDIVEINNIKDFIPEYEFQANQKKKTKSGYIIQTITKKLMNK